ncbi:MAG TPA: hypothetical protein VHS79_11650 [Actinomycetes bacterium]|jgi:hypothetical protein|nr:hypothetical protein [Actinomycetes bacterium]
MSHLIVSTATRPPALRDLDQDTTDAADRDRKASSRLWTLIEALAYAGAYVDPSGILAVQRLRQAKEEEEQRNGRR